MPPLDAIVRALPYTPNLGTENELGCHLAEQMGGRMDAVYDRGQFRRWDPSAPGWVLIPDDEVHRAASAYEGKMYCTPERPKTETTIRLSAGTAKGIVKQARVELARPGFFNEAVPGAAFKNVFARVDGNSVIYEDHDRDHRVYAEHVRPYDILPLREALKRMPTWETFLTETWMGCEDANERVEFLGECLGAAMLGISWRHKDSPLFVGVKDTGKSVLLTVIRLCFPEGTAAAVTLQAMSERFGLSPLLGASVNIVTELPAIALTASERAKGLLVADPVQIEEKYKTAFPFRCKIGHFFAANELPPATDDALRERLVVIDCPNPVPPEDQDKFLPEKLLAEIQAIASWAVQTADEGVVARGRFIRPPSSAGLAKAWRGKSDNVATWGESLLVDGGETGFVESSALYARYDSWCQQRKEKPVGRGEFGQRLARAGFRKANRGARGFIVRFRTPKEIAAARAAGELPD